MDEILKRLLDPDVEFDQIGMEELSQEDTLHLLRVVRGYLFQLAGEVLDMRDEMKIVDVMVGYTAMAQRHIVH